MSEEEDTSLPDTERQDYLNSFGITPADASPDILLQMIEEQFAKGLKTQVEPFPETDKEFGKLLDELRQLNADQLKEKLDISGWLLEPYGEDQMRCQECMYYLVHKRWCDLPELDLPAKPEWYCRLWRI